MAPAEGQRVRFWLLSMAAEPARCRLLCNLPAVEPVDIVMKPLAARDAASHGRLKMAVEQGRPSVQLCGRW